MILKVPNDIYEFFLVEHYINLTRNDNGGAKSAWKKRVEKWSLISCYRTSDLIGAEIVKKCKIGKGENPRLLVFVDDDKEICKMLIGVDETIIGLETKHLSSGLIACMACHYAFSIKIPIAHMRVLCMLQHFCLCARMEFDILKRIYTSEHNDAVTNAKLAMSYIKRKFKAHDISDEKN